MTEEYNLLSRILKDTENGYRLKTSTRNEIKKYISKNENRCFKKTDPELLDNMANIFNVKNQDKVIVCVPYLYDGKYGYIITEYDIDEMRKLIFDYQIKKSLKKAADDTIQNTIGCSNSIDSPVDGQRKKSLTGSDSNGIHF